MDEKRVKELALLGIVVSVLGVHHWRINKLKKLYWNLADVTYEHLQMDFQKDIDKVFEYIVENYDE